MAPDRKRNRIFSQIGTTLEIEGGKNDARGLNFLVDTIIIYISSQIRQFRMPSIRRVHP